MAYLRLAHVERRKRGNWRIAILCILSWRVAFSGLYWKGIRTMRITQKMQEETRRNERPEDVPRINGWPDGDARLNYYRTHRPNFPWSCGGCLGGETLIWLNSLAFLFEFARVCQFYPQQPEEHHIYRERNLPRYYQQGITTAGQCCRDNQTKPGCTAILSSLSNCCVSNILEE